MKILYVIPYFAPKHGGDVNVCYNLTKQLVKRGHEVTIITTDFEFDDESAKSIREAQIKAFKCIANFSLFLYSPKMKKWLRDNIKNFDIVHLHTYRSYQNKIIHQYTKKFKIPYIVQAHGSLPIIIQKQKLKKLYDRVWGHKILTNASRVIALNSTEADQYRQMGVNENNIVMVPNGIDQCKFKNLPTKGEFKKRYGIKDDEKIILYLGRLHKSKGIDLLVNAFAELSKKLDSVKLVLVGPDDGYKSTLGEITQNLEGNNKILFPGFISFYEKITAFVDADVFVTPRFSGFPVTFLEACACGTPIITTKKGDDLDWIHDNVGYVVDYNKEMLQNAILKIMDDERLQKRFGEEGKRLVREKFEWNRIVKDIEMLYFECSNSLGYKEKIIEE